MFLKVFQRLLLNTPKSVNQLFMLQRCALYLTSVLEKKNFRPPNRFTKISQTVQGSDDETFDDADTFKNDNLNDPVYQEILDRTFRVPQMGHNVLVIQPYIKWGSSKRRNTTPELQLAESVTLIRTLNMWTVADKFTVPLLTFDKLTLFGKGNLEKLETLVFQNRGISAVFISVDILKVSQKSFLEKLFKVPIFDRYTIVLQIFREHASSREAKLQLKLAEIPYLRGQITNFQPGCNFTGSSGETFVEFQHNILKEKEKKIRSAIDSLRSQRDLLRRKRKRSHMLVVAVVGYTNSGKTSLIKALTGEESMEPKDVLFATLDVTLHAGVLPSGLKVLYVDTIGFISDIPTTLLESFVATLEDAVFADVIVHVRDVSHPDGRAQADHVMETLHSLNLKEEILNNIVVVGNKVDLLESMNEEEWSNAHLVSAVKQIGLEDLKVAIENAVIKASRMMQMEIRVRNGGEEYQWLQREATLCGFRADPADLQYCIMSILIAPHVLAKFKHHFIAMK